jgi:hypothetical protein
VEGGGDSITAGRQRRICDIFAPSASAITAFHAMSQPLNLVAMAASELLYIRSHSDCKKVNAKSRGSLCRRGTDSAFIAYIHSLGSRRHFFNTIQVFDHRTSLPTVVDSRPDFKRDRTLWFELPLPVRYCPSSLVLTFSQFSLPQIAVRSPRLSIEADARRPVALTKPEIKLINRRTRITTQSRHF